TSVSGRDRFARRTPTASAAMRNLAAPCGRDRRARDVSPLERQLALGASARHVAMLRGRATSAPRRSGDRGSLSPRRTRRMLKRAARSRAACRRGGKRKAHCKVLRKALDDDRRVGNYQPWLGRLCTKGRDKEVLVILDMTAGGEPPRRG